MKIKDTTIAIGGLMRCCIATILAYIDAHQDDDVVDMVLDCMHEKPGNEQILLTGRTWKWNGLKR
jgi:hypothetical protein